jgi:hypothetical protein
MANESIATTSSETAEYNGVADAATVELLFKVQGVMRLLRSATEQLRVDEPCPDGVDTGIWAAAHLVDEALSRAGMA